MQSTQTPVQTNAWLPATWDEYLRALENPDHARAKGYYYQHHLRLETLPVGHDHAYDHVIVTLAVGLFALLKGIPLAGLDNCSYRKTGIREAQPDLSYYVGDRARTIASGTNVVDLDRYPAPNLVIEISKTTLLEDLGAKRSLYEALGVEEYWVVDVEQAQITAYAMTPEGSQQIRQSQVLPDLRVELLEEALRSTAKPISLRSGLG